MSILVLILGGMTATSAVAGSAGATPIQPVVINALADGRPAVRLDSNGNPVDAHDGELFFDAGRYWIIGMAYSCGEEWPARPTTGVRSTTCGVRGYSSTDLVTWRSEGYLIDGASMPAIPTAACTPACWRAKIVHSGAGWVIWVNSPYHRGTYRDYQVFRSPSSINGPYAWVGQAELSPPAGGFGEDFSLFDDPVTGRGYIASVAVGHGIFVQRLNASATGVDPSAAPTRIAAGAGQTGSVPNFAAAVQLQGRGGEAPMLTRGPNGKAYLILGATLCGFCTGGTGLIYSSAPSFDGPFPPAQSFIANACATQSTSIARVPTALGGFRWLYQGDRWWESPMTIGAPPLRFAGTTGNQGPATQWLEEMTFAASGAPQMSCHSRWSVPADIAAPTSVAPTDPVGVRCGATPGRSQYATVQVAAPITVQAFRLNTFASEAPDSAARLALMTPTGAILASGALPFAGHRAPPMTAVSWSAFTARIPTGATFTAADYTLVLTNPGSRGCYGLLTTAGNDVALRGETVPAGNGVAPAVLHTITPTRLLDTRIGSHRIVAGTTRAVRVTAVAGIPSAGVAGVAMTVTGVGALGPGWADVRPCTAGFNGTSTLNFRAQAVASGSGLFAPDVAGTVCVQVSATVDVILDATGWIGLGNGVLIGQPYRIADTRSGQGGVGGGPLTASTPRRVHTSMAAGAVAAVAATQIAGAAPGWLSVVSCDRPFPGTSTTNSGPGEIWQAMALAQVDAFGDICLRSNTAMHAVVDVYGVFRPGSGISQTNRRLLDTRPGHARLHAGQDIAVPVNGGAVVTLTAIYPSGSGWLAAHSCAGSANGTSTVNYQPPDTILSGSAMMSTSTARLCVRAFTATDLIVDAQASLPWS